MTDIAREFLQNDRLGVLHSYATTHALLSIEKNQIFRYSNIFTNKLDTIFTMLMQKQTVLRFPGHVLLSRLECVKLIY